MSGTDIGVNNIESFALRGDKFAILTSKQLIVEVDKSVVDKWLEHLKANETITGEFNEMKVIDLAAVTKIEANQKGVLIGVTYKTGEDENYEPFFMKDETVNEEILKSLRRCLQDGYTYSVTEYSPLKAIVLPLVVLGIVAVAGTFFTWFANLIHTQGGPRRTMRVQVWVAAIYWVLKWIGPTGAMIITGIGALACIVWMVKRMFNPPVKILIAKNN
ncbi:MAG TPA: hypothetical protein VEC37_08390 [Bacillota bacterium]|nr:hypothetical protein [Bacillota bacterium]